MNAWGAQRRFEELVAEGSPPLDLGAALIGAIDDPGAEADATVAALDRLADDLQLGAIDRLSPADQLGTLADGLGRRMGFVGSRGSFEGPQGSWLHHVLEHRTGLPILLSVVWIEVGRRLGCSLVGVGLPLHFVVGHALAPGVFADPFGGGEVLDVDGCRRLLDLRSAGRVSFDEAFLAPVAPRRILLRMLANLRGLYVSRQDAVSALRAAHLMVLTVPEMAELRRDRGVLALETGDGAAAAEDLRAYLAAFPEAADAAAVRVLLEQASDRGTTIH